MFCLKCEHQLTGTRSTNCPECGHPFHPRNPRTFARTRADLKVVRPARRTGIEFLWMLGIAAAIGVLMLLAIGGVAVFGALF